MTVRLKLLISQTLNALLVIGIAAVAVLVAQRFDYHLKRAELAYDQRQTITMLAVQAFRYKTLVERSTTDRSITPAQLGSARADIGAALEQLAKQTGAELDFVDQGDHGDEVNEVTRVANLEAELRTIDALVPQMMEQRQAGRQEEALATHRVIEAHFEDKIAAMLADAMSEEQQEVIATDARVAELAEARVMFLIVVGIGALVLSLATGIALDRSLSEPLRQLLAGVRALKSGDLGHRVPTAGRDEFAELGAQFNDMAAALGKREQELVQASGHLEHEVRQRTAELASANDRLKYLDRRRLLFLAEVSHELRTPVTVLRGEAEVTLRVEPKSIEGYREALARISRQAEQMGRIIDDLMFLVRSEADTVAFDRQPLDLRDAVSDAVRDGLVLARSKQVQLQHHMPDKPLRLHGDAQRLRQAALIAVDNAVKYCDEGSTVEVLLERQDSSAVVIVRNLGPGIPADELPYVFERFYRIRSDQGRRADGTGLGLPIAKWIAEKHGGTVTLASTPGAWTVLTIALPLTETTAA